MIRDNGKLKECGFNGGYWDILEKKELIQRVDNRKEDFFCMMKEEGIIQNSQTYGIKKVISVDLRDGSLSIRQHTPGSSYGNEAFYIDLFTCHEVELFDKDLLDDDEIHSFNENDIDIEEYFENIGIDYDERASDAEDFYIRECIDEQDWQEQIEEAYSYRLNEGEI